MNPWGQLLGEQVIPQPEARGKVNLIGTARREGGRPIKLKVGDQVGEWTLLAFVPGAKKPERIKPRWVCRCSCGVVREVKSDNLNAGTSQSCGHGVPNCRWVD